MKILIKDNTIDFKEINAWTMLFFKAVSASWECYPDPVITSANDGKHMAGSLHYKNRAWDLRSRDLSPEQQQSFAKRLKNYLGPSWDVIIEKDHFHIEADRV